MLRHPDSSATRWPQQSLLALGMLWTLPNSLPGLLLGVAGVPFGARMRWQPRDLALVVRCWPWGRKMC